ncbi:elongation factor G [Acidisarcina polymorpha]|nr:elongation factor G [Acidisarcina polymorpha]
MNIFSGTNIRNIAVTGHSHCGKTTLISAMLATAGAVSALGRVEDGTAVTAYDEEEISRHMTLSNAVAWCEWNGVKVNCIDTPGFSMFVHEAKAAMLPVESAVVLVDACAGVEPMTTRVWGYAEEFSLPRILVVNKLDRDTGKRASSGSDCLDEALALLDGLRNSFGRNVVPVQLPIGMGGAGSGAPFTGVIDLVSMKAFLYPAGGNGKGTLGEIPPELLETAKSAHEALVELVAEGKDELMEEFFAEGTIPEEHLISALHEAIREDRIFPVLFTAALPNIGTDRLLEFLRVYAPAPVERAPIAARSNASQSRTVGNGHASNEWTNAVTEMVTRPVADDQPLSLYIFKTISDPFAGHISFFKVFSGVVRNDAAIQNYNRNTIERFGHLAIMEGKVATSVTELHAGDIGAVAKLKSTFTGDTLGDKAHAIFFEPAALPEPAIAFAIEPKTRADEDKLATGLHRLMEEDTLIRFYRDPQTHEFLIAGTGQQHIEVVVSKLRKRYHTEVTLQAPKVPYRETIRAAVEARGRHKKQSGGHGQFGDCVIRIEPLPRGAGFEFVNDIFGGAVPKNYIPAIEKGIQEAALRGYLAGYPVVDFRVILKDGSYHDVDSNELSFRMAGRIAFRKCIEQARAAIIEPIMRGEIDAPEVAAGVLMGDLNGRRGKVQGMESRAGALTLRAEVPMAEMLTYGADLTAMTQGLGSFHMELDHYECVPAAQQEKIIAASTQRLHADEEDE